METSKILNSSLLDILFDGRNKAYGAYELRNTYGARLRTALIITGGIVACFVGMVYAKPEKREREELVKISGPLIIDNIKTPPPPVALPKPEVPKLQIAQKAATIKFVIPKIAADDKVITPPPSQDEFTDMKIGLDNVKGERLGDLSLLNSDGSPDGKGILDVKPKEKEEEIASVVNVEASYPGDWARFLTTHLRAEVPIENGAAPGSYQVLVQFVVDVNGVVSDIRILKNPGFEMAREAERVIKRSGKWKPAILNGYPVKAYRKQLITFQVLE